MEFGELALLMVFFTLAIMAMGHQKPSGKIIKRARKEFNVENPTIIRYDKRDVKVLKICFIVHGAIALVSLIVCFMLRVMDTYGKPETVTQIIVATAIAESVFAIFFTVAVFMAAYYVEAKLYLKKLDEYDYYVPENKKDFYYAVEGLPVALYEEDDSIIIPEAGEKAKNGNRNKDSIILAITCGITTVLIGISAVVYHIMWGKFFRNGWKYTGFACVCWLLGAIVWYRQSDEGKYRDEIDIDKVGKVRRNLCPGISLYVFYLIFTLIMLAIVWDVTSVMYNDLLKYYRG